MKRYNSNLNRVFCYHSCLNDGVTGSCHILDFKFSHGLRYKVILDLGLFLGGETEKTKEASKAEEESNNYFLPIGINEVSAILISHAHTDHIGRLPLLVHLGYGGPIYVTYGTSRIIEDALMDTCNCLRRESKYLFSQQDVKKTISLLKIVNYNEETTIVDDGERKIVATFLSNGHLLGSSMISIQGMERGLVPVNVFYTGDYRENNVFLKAKRITKKFFNLPTNLIIESTYGNSDSTNIEYSFKNNVVRAAKRKGSIIIPVIALERAELVLYNLKKLRHDKLLSSTIPIYLVGNLATEYLKLYSEKDPIEREKLGLEEDMKNFLPENFSVANGEDANAILKSKKQMIVLATPGMLSGGHSNNFLMKHIENENDLIQITSYMASEFGDSILNAKNGDKLTFLNGKTATVKAEIRATGEFSGHAKRDELLNLINKFKNLECVTIVHGEPEVKQSFENYVRSSPEFPKKVPVVVGWKNQKIRYSTGEPKIINYIPENMLETRVTVKKNEEREYHFNHNGSNHSKK